MSFKSWLFKEEQSMLQIPSKKQETLYDCGPAALYAIIKYFKIKPSSYEDLVKDCKTTNYYGTDPKNIIKVASDYGLKTKEYNDMTLKQLESVLDKEKPVIINIQAWCNDNLIHDLSCGHYVIAIGYDENNIYYKDPFFHAKNTSKMAKHEFLKRWKDKKSNGKILNHHAISFWK